MNTSIFIARRYLVSSKKMHVINIISAVSMAGVLIGTAALIIVLSVFNGLEKVIIGQNSNFAPDLRIEARLGKSFNPHTAYFDELHKNPHVFSFTQILQDKVMIQYREKPYIGRITGVSEEFLRNRKLDSTILEGSFALHTNNSPMAVIGVTVHNSLAVSPGNTVYPLQIYAPRRGAASAISPGDEFITRSIYTSGVFSIQQDYDDMVVVPIEFTRELFDEPVNVSSLDINFKKGADITAIQNKLQAEIGKDFTIKNRQEQDTSLYKTLNLEKWSVFMILTFVIIIAAFNIVGSLTILVIDKRKDIAILTSLGAGKILIQGVFFFEGLMISLTGCLIGIVLGWVFCILQQHYGLIQVGGMNVPNNAYPVDIKGGDFLLVFFTVLAIAAIASGISARLSIKGLDDIKQDL
ncbi:ABC transporter permease [Mucilaginibacter sp. dw_454]|uniref:ABC transporter permease n=1 Tax=Mucilaginibacter sp. dw_454 TaxID=2720079 RepID=UPI001BD68329|nr:ABC transporter permease [Mucilaginibacter sp. dw_454]